MQFDCSSSNTQPHGPESSQSIAANRVDLDPLVPLSPTKHDYMELEGGCCCCVAFCIFPVLSPGSQDPSSKYAPECILT